MKATFRITEDDYVAASKLATRTSRTWAVVLIIAALLFLMLGLWGPQVLRETAVGGLIGGVAGYSVFKWLISPFMARSNYRKYKAIQSLMSVEVQAEGIVFANDDGSGLVRWDAMHKWRQNGTFVLVFLMPRLYYMVPCSVDSDDFPIAGLVDLLEDKLGAES